MTQRVYLVRSGEARRECKLPYEGALHVEVDGTCPECGVASFGARGTGRRPSADDQAWEADALSTCCNKPIGTLRVEVSTIFGVREDEAVMNGRCRVY